MLTFRVPSSWANTRDTPFAYTLQYVQHERYMWGSIEVLSEAAIPDQDATCELGRKAGARARVSDWVDFLTTHPGLSASQPKPVSVDGYEGVRVTVHAARTWSNPCVDQLGPALMVVADDALGRDRFIFLGDGPATLTLVDVAGKTIVFKIGASDVYSLQRLIRRAERVIGSFGFLPSTS